MLKRIGFSNFTSFKECVEVNLELDGKVPQSLRQGRDISTVLGIKGANGSGKTNILRALSFLSYFCTQGAREPLGKKKDYATTISKLAADSFFRSDEPIEFYVDFIRNGKEYSYELTILNGYIHKEYISRKELRTTILIERTDNEITRCLKLYDEYKSFKLRGDTSILEMLSNYSFKNDISELKDIYNFFLNIMSNVTYDGYCEIDFSLTEETELFYNNNDVFEFVRELIKASDSSIDNIEIKKIEDSEGNDIYLPVFYHYIDDGSKPLPYSQQSHGTKKLYMVMSSYFNALRNGGILVLDEFDIHLHSLVLPLIINLFSDPAINTNNAQFIFTAHNTEIIDTLGKYRTLLVNKEYSESYAYRLDEIPGTMVRNDRSILPIYMEGKIGGVPKIEKENLRDYFQRFTKNEK